jgi:predicted AAA+ superfamily ATPase
MDRGRLKASLDDWQAWYERALAGMLPRQVVPSLPRAHALALIGVRRAGKTWLAIEAARRSGLRTLYYNFEDPLFHAEPNVSGIDTLLSVYAEHAGAEPALAVLDEVQNVDGWERWVRKATDTRRCRLVLTGSSAKLLSSELATAIAGRSLAHTVWPLGLRERMTFTGTRCRTATEHVGATRAYLQWGGLPEVALTPEAHERTRILKQYVDDIVLKDVLSRHSVRAKRRLDQVVAYAMTNAGCLFSHARVKGAFGVDVQTSQEYFGYLEDAFLAFAVPRFHRNLKQQARDPHKLYVVDTGLRNAYARTMPEDMGRMAENAVYVELRRRGHDVTYWQAEQGEVDFVLRDGPRPTAAIQATWSSLEPGKTRDREVRALVACLEALDLGEGTILTLDREERLVERGRRIRLMPVWQFLLEGGGAGR